jgi:hypothetical protein
MRHAGTQAFAARGSAVAPCHAGRGPGFVYEDELVGIKIELSLEPVFTPLQDVGTILLRRVCGLFLRVIPLRSKNRQSEPIATGVPQRPAVPAIPPE